MSTSGTVSTYGDGMAEPTTFNQRVIAEFRANAGQVGGPFRGAPLLLLHTAGARTGAARVNPVMFRRLGDSFAVFGSKAGAPDHPAWYHNLLANPDATVEVGDETIEVRARVVTGAEREDIWTAQKKDYPGFADYQSRTDRVIPVVVLDPR